MSVYLCVGIFSRHLFTFERVSLSLSLSLSLKFLAVSKNDKWVTIRLIGSFPCFSLWILKGREKNETGVAPRDIETHKDIEGYSLFFYSYLSLSFKDQYFLDKIRVSISFIVKILTFFQRKVSDIYGFNFKIIKSWYFVEANIFNNYDIIKPIDQTLFLFNFFFLSAKRHISHVDGK